MAMLRCNHERATSGECFAFGANWRNFLRVLNEERILQAEQSLKTMLETDTLEGRRFLDIGCGSGLFSLAAHQAGAAVHSFDSDPEAVACTQELKDRFFPDSTRWTIEEASVLDEAYVSSLDKFDIVYAWGVLHHTGDMWQALDYASIPLAPGGWLYIAIYDDAGVRSRLWVHLKRICNRLPNVLRMPYILLVSIPRAVQLITHPVLLSILGGEPFPSNAKIRGMSRWYDMIDWVGGYPYEFAKPERIFDFYRERGLALQRLLTVGGDLACNEFVFRDIRG